MKNLVKLLLLFTLTFTLCTAQTSVSTLGISPRVAGLDTTDIYDMSFSGLQNVGVGTKVFLKGSTSDSAGLATPTWNLLSVPTSSTAAFGTTADEDNSWYDTHDEAWVYDYSQATSFVADLLGTYVVEFVNGGIADTLTINAAMYLGMDGGVGCGTCHPEKATAWEATGHADMLERGLEGTLSSYYNSGCISCHTVGYDTSAVNDGFDDLGFTFPDSLYEGGYAASVTAYPDAMGLANIQCESCHGPGGSHNSVITDSKMVADIKTYSCAFCHDDGHYHVYPEQWDVSGHASESALYNSSYAGGSCVPCHNGQGFVNSIKEVSETLVEKIPITCATCHDPHDATNAHQLRNLTVSLGDDLEIPVTTGGNGQLCMNCHKSRRNSVDYTTNYLDNISSHYGPHHGPQSDMYYNLNIADFGTAYESSGHSTVLENACATCHMGPAVSDGHVAHTGGHTFAMSEHGENDNMQSCAQDGCHGGTLGNSFDGFLFSWNGVVDHDGDGVDEGLQVEVAGLLENLSFYLPPVGEYTVGSIDTTFTANQALALYNYLMVVEDRSMGVHNPKLTIGMLTDAIEQLGGIVSVNSDPDIPAIYELHQNYPNPFNPSTTIKFAIPEATNVRLTIFNAIGEAVAVLIDTEKQAGSYTMNWNASHNASGIYFYRLETANFVSVKKMMLIK